MLTGSMAVNHYALPRMTRDIDFVLDMKPGDSPRMMAAFQDDYFVRQEAIESALKHRSMFNLIHHETVLKVDCILLKSADYARAEFDRRQPITVRDEDMHLDFQTVIVTKEDLILAKLRLDAHVAFGGAAKGCKEPASIGLRHGVCFSLGCRATASGLAGEVSR
jgi:hypothetical protein